MMRFDKFTEKAQEAAMRAYEILQQYKHTQVDTEHVFLALVRQQDSAVPQILQQLDAPADIIAGKLEAVLESAPRSTTNPYGSAPTAQVFITPRLKRVMDVANEEAKKLEDEYISTEHLLLALVDGAGVATQVMNDSGVTRESLMDALKQVRGSARNRRRHSNKAPSPCRRCMTPPNV